MRFVVADGQEERRKRGAGTAAIADVCVAILTKEVYGKVGALEVWQSAFGLILNLPGNIK